MRQDTITASPAEGAAAGGNGNENERREDLKVLEAAHAAWTAWSGLRRRRKRNKDFTYGRQWGDITRDASGFPVTEGELSSSCGKEPLTNNLLRQLVKCVVGRFRKSIDDEKKNGGDDYAANCVDEIDSRALEEFLISGCCVQRVEWADPLEGGGVSVSNVNVNRFFANRMEDPRGRDCEIAGCLHDMRLSEIIRLLADGNPARARRIKSVYSHMRGTYRAEATGGDNLADDGFWRAEGGKCRAIEVWTLELSEMIMCHDCENATAWLEPTGHSARLNAENAARQAAAREPIMAQWTVVKVWHCRWFAPDGTLLRHFTSPFGHRSHPFVFKLYPLTDGEVHSFIEDVIDQQKYVNRMVSVLDHILNASAKGVLLFPEDSLPAGYTWEKLRAVWSSSNGVIPFVPDASGAMPTQVVSKAADAGAYQLLQTQMKLIEQISGVTSVLSGQGGSYQGATVYEKQLENADTSLADIYGAFATFRAGRDAKAAALRRQ